MTRKKYILLSFFSLLLISSIIFAGTQFKIFSAHSEADNMIIDWQTTEEVNVISFSVERSTPNGAFVDIVTIPAQGSFSYYRYVDEGVYKTSSKIYYYKIRINDGSSKPGYSQTISSTMGSVSGFKSTWGSIKALFR